MARRRIQSAQSSIKALTFTVGAFVVSRPRHGRRAVGLHGGAGQLGNSPRPNTMEAAMPRAMRVCPKPDCPEITTGGPCPTHRAEYERRRGTRQQRGYDAEYDRARRRWAPKVAACTVHCHAPVCIEPARLILPHQPWDLGHDEQRNIRGPEHASCNRSAGGRAAHQ